MMMDRNEEAARLHSASGYDEVFSVVKAHVEATLGRHRAGLTLGLSVMPPEVGAYHVVGSNMIVINRTLLEAISKREPQEIVNSFLYVVLLHEYLHSLGMTDEGEVSRVGEMVASTMLGKRHPAAMLMSRPLLELFPYISSLPRKGDAGAVEVVRDFDRDSYPYIR
jgi:hypothetical protein